MELRQLKYFIKAAELTNFTEASQSLNISQSTLSQQIKQLEDELDIPLFDRIGKRVALTEAGKLFLPHAQKTVRQSEDGRERMKDLKQLEAGCLTIGVTYGLSALLTNAIVLFAAAYPNIQLNIEFGTSVGLMDLLQRSQLDFVLSFVPVQQNQNFVSHSLFQSSLSLIVHQNHPFANRKNITLQQLVGLPLILPVAGFSIRSFLDNALQKSQLQPTINMEINDIGTLLTLVDTNNWCTVLMKTTLFNYPSLRAVPIKGKGMTRDATITWPVNMYRKKSAAAFAELLMEVAKKIV